MEKLTIKSTQSSFITHAAVVIIPILFLFLTVFVARSDARWFYALIFAMLFGQAVLVRKSKLSRLKMFAVALISLASVGLSAASILTLEKIELIKNPAYVTSCSFSPVVGCSPVIASPQATAIGGVPNPIFGIFGYACLLCAGMTILAGAEKLSKYWWWALLSAIGFGVGFSIWLIHEGVYEIGALCLYCMSVWMITFSLFWLAFSEAIQQKVIPLPKKIGQFIVKNRDSIMATTIGIIVVLLYFRWSDYWNSLF